MKKKITFIDIIIIAIVVIAGVFVLSKFSGGGASKTETVTYKVLVANQIPEIAQQITAAENVLLDPKENGYGNVTAVELKPAEESYFDARNERYVTRTTDLRTDVFITIEANAAKSDAGWKIGAQNIRIGESQSISANTYGVEGYIVDILN